MKSNIPKPSVSNSIKLFSSVGALLGSAVLTFAAPTLVSLNPSRIVEAAGDHVAFTVTANSSSGALTYQWLQNNTVLTGQTTATLLLTNIQPASSGQYTVVVSDSSGSVSNSATLTVSTNYLPLYPTNLVVARLGDGSQKLSAGTGNTLYLDQYTQGGVYVSSLQIPDETPGAATNGSSKSTFGSPALIFQGAGSDAPYGAALTTSGNQQFITLAGYELSYPYSGTDVTASGGNGGTLWRGIYAINGLGYPTLIYTNTGLYSGGNHTIRSGTTLDGTNIWTTGQAGSGGVKFMNATVSSYATGTGIPVVTSSGTGPRVVQIVNGNLVFSDWSGSSGSGIYISPGYPEPVANGSAASSLLINEGGHPVDFAASPDGQTVYISDDLPFGGTNVQSGGIERWDTNTSSGGYTYSYTFAANSGTNGARGLAVYFPTNISAWGAGVTGAVVFAVSADTNANTLSRIIDNGPASTATVLATAGTNQALRGLRFGPSVVSPVSIASQPLSQTNFVNSSVTFSVGVSGAAPYYYQWLSNSIPISGATRSSYTVTNLQLNAAASYSVIVSNGVSFTTSSNAVLTVVSGPPQLISATHSLVEAAGSHDALAIDVTGNLPIRFQWSFNGTPILNATNNYYALKNLQSANVGSYLVVASNSIGTLSNTFTVTVLNTLPQLSSNNLIVARVGDGSEALSSFTGNTVYLDQFTSAGNYVNTLQIPDTLPSGLVVSGGTNDGIYGSVLTLSQNKAFLNIAGFNIAQPYTGNSASGFTAPGTTVRGIGAIDPFGFYTLALTNKSIYNASTEFRGVVSSEGQLNFWTTGVASSAGVKFVSPDYATGGIPALSGSLAGTRVIDIDPQGNIAWTDTGAGFTGLNVFSGEPTQTYYATPSLLINVGTNGSPNDFAISPDYNTVYIADDNFATNNGGVQRWDNVGGSWVNSYTLAASPNGFGARGLTVDFSASATWGAGTTGAVLYVTTAAASENKLVRIVDNGNASTASSLESAGPNQLLRGLRFGPSATVPVSIVSDLQSTNGIASGSVTFQPTLIGSGPFYYQWSFNGVNITGATNAYYTVTNLSNGAAGGYSVLISNLLGSAVQSGTAQLSVLAQPQFSSSTPLGTNGFKLNFTGPASIGYSLWSSTNSALRPVTSKWKLVTTNQFSGSLDSYTDLTATNGSRFYVITVP